MDSVVEAIANMRGDIMDIRQEVVGVKEEIVGLRQDALNRAAEERRYITTTVWTAMGVAAAGLGVLITWLLR